MFLRVKANTLKKTVHEKVCLFILISELVEPLQE